MNPDWRLWEKKSWEATRSIGDVDIVVIKDYYGIGRHTGVSYGFSPFEAIDATGTVKDKNIEFTFLVQNGKSIIATIDACGKIVGPPGFYTKIGGLIM